MSKQRNVDKQRNTNVRVSVRAFGGLSYIGNEDEQEDFRCAGEHGTQGVKMFEINGEHGQLCESIALTYTNQGHVQIEEDTMTMLIPDRDRPNQEDFIWCVPIERVKWNKWYALSEKFKTCVPVEHGGGVRYMNRMEGRSVKTVLLLPNESQSDDDAVTACAYLRMVKELSCRMYIVRCTDDPLTGARLIHKVAGANVEYVEEVEFVNESSKDET